MAFIDSQIGKIETLKKPIEAHGVLALKGRNDEVKSVIIGNPVGFFGSRIFDIEARGLTGPFYAHIRRTHRTAPTEKVREGNIGRMAWRAQAQQSGDDFPH